MLQNPNRYGSLRLRELRSWLDEVTEAVAPQYDSFSLRLVSDREIARLNEEFRGRSGATDVLSFAGEETLEGRHLGDVVISVPTARRQAAARGHAVERELRVLALHGLLHCLGYDHETDRGEMERLERRLRRRWIDDGDAR